MRKAVSSIPRAALRASSKGVGRSLIGGTRSLATPATAPSSNDIFANGGNAYYADEMYRRWKEDAKSVHSSWDAYFSGLEKGLPSSQAFQSPPLTVTQAAGPPPLLSGGMGNGLSDHLKVISPLPRGCPVVVC